MEREVSPAHARAVDDRVPRDAWIMQTYADLVAALANFRGRGGPVDPWTEP